MWTAQSNPIYNEHVFHPQPSVQRFERASTEIRSRAIYVPIDRNLLTFRVSKNATIKPPIIITKIEFREQKLISLIFSYHELAMKIFAFPPWLACSDQV